MVAAFFLALAHSGGWGQGLQWSQDIHFVKESALQQGKEILVLLTRNGEDPYLGPQAEIGQIVVAWASRAYLPLKVNRPEQLTESGFRWRSFPPRGPALVIFNPLREERSRLEGPVPTAPELREFLRLWTVAPLFSIAPTQIFRSESALRGNGEGIWSWKGEFYWEWGQSGPYLLLRNAIGDFFALPLLGGWAYRKPAGREGWERAFFGGFE